MKRIKEACICQTLHFMLKEDVGHDYAVRIVQEEIAKYKASDKSLRQAGKDILCTGQRGDKPARPRLKAIYSAAAPSGKLYAQRRSLAQY